MSQNQFHLLKSRRFLPLFVTQFLGSLNDNLFRHFLAILITFELAQSLELDGQILVTLAMGVFVLPFFLFSAMAGQLADKFEKSASIRLIKLAEVAIMVCAAAGFLLEQPYFLLAVLFFMGTQSAFFGPLKYSILPDHLKDDELVGGNALVETATFVAILLGTILGGVVSVDGTGVKIVAACLVLFAVLGWGASFRIPRAEPPAPNLKISLNVIRETLGILRFAADNRKIWLTILGISWFWLVGATFLSQFPAFTKDVLGADQSVGTLFMVVFSLGIAAGSLLCNKILKGEISPKYVPFAALGMTVFLADFYLATRGAAPVGTGLAAIKDFAAVGGNWRILVDLFAIAACGGMFTVPLYAILQHDSDPEHRSRTIAANNIANSAFVVAGAVGAAGLLASGVSIQSIFILLAALNAVAAIYICGILPDALIKAFLKAALKFFYRVDVRGLENYEKAGKRAVVVVNHVSFLDAVLLATYLPVKPMFAINKDVAKAWWVKPFLGLVDAFPIDPTNPMATKSMIREVQKDKHCVIFPEGRITVTGALMKIYEGPGMVADKADAELIPIRIDGAQFTPFSRLRGKLRLRWFPKITMTILPPQKFEIPADAVGRARRQIASVKLYDVMSKMMFETCDTDQTLYDALLDAKAAHGGSAVVAEDIERQPITYSKMVLGTIVLGRKLAALTSAGEYVGVMLPNSVGAVVTFFGLQAYGRVPAMLNFSTGSANMISAVTTAQVKTVFTSRRFIEMGKLDDVAAALAEHVKIVYLEDIRETISAFDKISGLLSSLFARKIHERIERKADDPAVVLFTSGSEGTPKGVVLSHRNLLSNRHQLAACVDFNPTDIVFNALPIFHSFGMTGGMLLPVLSGIKTFFYPSPLHYRIVPALVYDTNATIMFGTDTFLTGYARVAHPYDFYSLRYVFAGAEKVKDETRRTWADKFGLRILEGYGATETSPVLAANTPMHFKPGTVGRLMPGIEYDLEPVPGIDAGGKLVVSGPNIMKGYLRAEKPGVLEPPADGKYDTGDIVSVDADGFVTIQGRAKRFAKIAGEMVSLTAVEGLAAAVWPDSMSAAVNIPDERKGEQVILFTDNADADRAALVSHAQANGMPELFVPKGIKVIDAVPVLGTGKIDYVTVGKMAAEL